MSPPAPPRAPYRDQHSGIRVGQGNASANVERMGIIVSWREFGKLIEELSLVASCDVHEPGAFECPS